MASRQQAALAAQRSAKAALGLANNALTGGAAPYSIPGIYNLRRDSLPIWQAALADVETGAGRARRAFPGHSWAMGKAAGSGGFTDARPNSFPVRAAEILAQSLTINDGSLCGYGAVGNGTTALGNDPRYSLGTGWQASNLDFNSLGGSSFKSNTSSSGALTFTPAGNFDTIRVYYINSAGGNFNINLDGVKQGATVATTSNGSFLMTERTVSLGNAAITITRDSGDTAPFNIVMIETFDSTTPAVDFYNMGWSGSTIAQWAANTNRYDPLKALYDDVVVTDPIMPHLTVMVCSINDMITATSLSSFGTSWNDFATAATAQGDLIVVLDGPVDTNTVSQANQDAYLNVVRQVAKDFDVPWIDCRDLFVSFAAADAPFFKDDVHPNTRGAYLIGRMAAKAVLPI